MTLKVVMRNGGDFADVILPPTNVRFVVVKPLIDVYA
jgi:hypothetical protein